MYINNNLWKIVWLFVNFLVNKNVIFLSNINYFSDLKVSQIICNYKDFYNILDFDIKIY